MRHTRLVAGCCALTMAATLGSATTSERARATTGDGEQVYLGSRGDLDVRGAGMPTAGAPLNLQIEGGSVEYVNDDDGLYFRVVMRQASTPDNDGVLTLGIGRYDDAGACRAGAIIRAPTSGPRAQGRVLSYSTSETSGSVATCAAASVTAEGDDTVLDAVSGALEPIHVRAVTKVEIKAPKRVRLVRGVPSRIPVRVTDVGTVEPADNPPAIVGRGEGVNVGRASDYGRIFLPTRLTTDRRRTAVMLLVKDGDRVVGRTRLTVRRVPPPVPPLSGRYRGEGVAFRVEDGRVVGFRATVSGECFVDVDFQSFTRTISHPAVPIQISNQIYDQAERQRRATELALRFTGVRAARGNVEYVTQGGVCVGSTTFTAARVAG